MILFVHLHHINFSYEEKSLKRIFSAANLTPEIPLLLATENHEECN